jgi:hypothetical protein
MPSKKHSLLAGIILFVGVGAVVLLIVNMMRLYFAMPTKTEMLRFAGQATDVVTESGVEVIGSLVPDSGDTSATAEPSGQANAAAGATIKQDWLSPEQRRTLSKLGIDESKLPATLTPELEACFVEAIGEVRVEAIKLGDSPTVVEGMKAAACL